VTAHSRRSFLGSAGLGGIGLAAIRPAERQAGERGRELPPLDRPTGSPEAVARDETHELS